MGAGVVGAVDLKYYAPRLVITVSDQELAGDVISVQLSEKLNAATEATITVNDEI